jgi:hypothetical protein
MDQSHARMLGGKPKWCQRVDADTELSVGYSTSE